MTAVALFVEAAMNPDSDGWDQDHSLAENEFMYEGCGFQIGSPEHALLGATATRAFSEYLPQTTLTLSMGETARGRSLGKGANPGYFTAFNWRASEPYAKGFA